MTVNVEIANLAGLKLGDGEMRGPDDDRAFARSVRVAWDITRKAAIRDGSWNFASGRAQLAAVALNAVPHPWAYAFQLPADNLRLLGVDGWSREDYAIEGQRLFAYGLGPIDIRYLKDVTEPSLWDALFVEAFACRLAWQVADRVTGDRGRRDDMWNAYQLALRDAKRVDARESPRIDDEPTDWELARMGGWSGGWNGFGPPLRIPCGYPTGGR